MEDDILANSYYYNCLFPVDAYVEGESFSSFVNDIYDVLKNKYNDLQLEKDKLDKQNKYAYVFDSTRVHPIKNIDPPKVVKKSFFFCASIDIF
mgnify:CR=1 FL=1